MKNNRLRNFQKAPIRGSEGMLADLLSILPNIIYIALFIGAYYLITTRNLFPDWITYIYWGTKVVVAYNIIAASARSLFAPFFALSAGLLCLFTSTVYQITLISSQDAWQVIVVAGIGALVAFLLKK